MYYADKCEEENPQEKALEKKVAANKIGNMWKSKKQVDVNVNQNLEKQKLEQCQDQIQDLSISKPDEDVWEEEQEKQLLELVKKYGNNNWNEICSQIPNKTSDQCKKMFQQLVQKV